MKTKKKKPSKKSKKKNSGYNRRDDKWCELFKTLYK